jgi:DME family drug/metabolite transporter
MSPRMRIAVAALLFSTGGAAIKYASLTGWQIASFRSLVAAVVLWLALPAARRGISWRAAVVGVAYAVTLVTFVLANRMTTGANAIYLQSTSPLFLILVAPLLLKEPIRRSDIPILLAVLVGMLLVMSGNDAPSETATNPALGNMLGLLSGAAYALMICGLRWLGRADDTGQGALAAVVLGNAMAGLAALPMAFPLATVLPADWAVILYLGAFQIGLAYVLVTRGLRDVPALDAALILLVETALNPVWTWLLLGERPGLASLAGGAVIVAATAAQAMRGSTAEPITA